MIVKPHRASVILLAECGGDDESDVIADALIAAARAALSRGASITVIGDVDAVVLGAIVAREFETGAGAIRLFVLPAEETAMGNDEARETLQESIKAQWLDGQTWVEKALSLIRSEAATILAMGSGQHLAALLEHDLNTPAARACHLVSLRHGETPRRLQGWGELPDFNQGDGYYLDFELTFEGRVLRPSDDNDEARAVWTLAQSTRWRIATALAIERVIAAQIGEVETSAE